MADIEGIEEFGRFPLRYAYEFLEKKGLSDEANKIRQSKDSYKSYDSSLRRGKIISLMEANKLLEEFIDKFWPTGKTEQGAKELSKGKRILNLFLSKDKTEEEDEEERVEETSFAYEDDLRDYLSNNLSVIEAGLTLFKSEDGVDGIEYSVDADNKRIDILALDKGKTPVIIELKVSRGYEKVIGQCLYYKNRIKQAFHVPKVRIVIIAREITPQLKTAVEDLPDVELFEYNLSVKLAKVK